MWNRKFANMLPVKSCKIASLSFSSRAKHFTVYFLLNSVLKSLMQNQFFWSFYFLLGICARSYQYSLCMFGGYRTRGAHTLRAIFFRVRSCVRWIILGKLPDARFFGTVMSEFLPEVRGDHGVSGVSWRRPDLLFGRGVRFNPNSFRVKYSFQL